MARKTVLFLNEDEARVERDQGRRRLQVQRVDASGWPAWNVACGGVVSAWACSEGGRATDLESQEVIRDVEQVRVRVL